MNTIPWKLMRVTYLQAEKPSARSLPVSLTLRQADTTTTGSVCMPNPLARHQTLGH